MKRLSTSTVPVLNTRRVAVLGTKSGATEMERGRAWMAKRDRVALRHGWKCAACGLVLRAGGWECDHIVPREQGGTNDESNLQPLCTRPCHEAKTAAEAATRAGKC